MVVIGVASTITRIVSIVEVPSSDVGVGVVTIFSTITKGVKTPIGGRTGTDITIGMVLLRSIGP